MSGKWVIATCARCEGGAKLLEKEWSPTRKPWCKKCKQATNTCGSRSVLRGSQEQSRETRRKQYRANAWWRRRNQNAKDGIIRVIKEEEIDG